MGRTWSSGFGTKNMGCAYLRLGLGISKPFSNHLSITVSIKGEGLVFLKRGGASLGRGRCIPSRKVLKYHSPSFDLSLSGVTVETLDAL